MAEISYNTAELEAVARSFQRCGVGGEAREDFETAGLPDEYWPSMVTADVPGVYRELVDDTLRCARLLQESVAAVGTALDGVARHYRRMEDRHGKDFDGLGDKM